MFAIFDSHCFQFYITGYKQRKKVTFLIIFEWLFIYANCPALLIQCSALNTTMTRASSVGAQERHFFGWTFPWCASLRLCREMFWMPTKAECTRVCVDLESNWETHLEPQVFFLVIIMLMQCPGVQVSDMEVWGCFCHWPHWNKTIFLLRALKILSVKIPLWFLWCW